MKLFEKIRIANERELRVLGMPVIQWGEKSEISYSEKYLEVFPRRGFKETFFNKILDFLKEQNIDFDDIYISRMNIGETVLLCGLIKNWIKTNKSKKPIVILTNNYHKDIFDLYCPNVNYVFYPIKKHVMDGLLQKTYFKYKGHRIFYYIIIIIGILGRDGTHFSKFIKDTLKIDNYDFSDFLTNNENIPDKFLKTGINKNNFVIIFPESTSCKSLDNDFWDKLSEELKKLGYDVFCNVVNHANKINGTYHEDLSLSELYSVSKYAKAIIGMRSGIFDYLASIDGLKIIALYTRLEYWNITSENMIKAYSLKELPFKHTNNIFEYDVELLTGNSIMENVFKDIERG